MYYHLLNRICMVANPYIQGMIQHFHQYKEDPAAPPHNLPTHGGPAVAWRLLVSEAARASRDVSLAPQFANAVLSPMNSTCLPVPSLRIFGLPPQFLFALASYALAATDVFLPSHPSYSQVEDILFQACSGAVEAMYAPSNYWTYQLTPNHPPFSEDLSVQEARTLILATYPRSAHSNNPDSRPPSPTNPTAPHTSCLDTYRRGLLLEGLVRKFNSPAIILQTLTALYPGGPPGGKDTIPLHEVLMELGEVITSNQQTVEAIVDRWWTPWILDAEDRQLVDNEITTTLHGLLSGREKLRTVHLGVVIQVFMLIVSQAPQAQQLTKAWSLVALRDKVIRLRQRGQQARCNRHVDQDRSTSSANTGSGDLRTTPRHARRSNLDSRRCPISRHERHH